MHKVQKKRHEERGWKVGTIPDFLKLSKEEQAYIDLKIALGKSIKTKRSTKKMTQVELAQKLSSSQSRVAKIEMGHPSVSMDLQVKALLVLGATQKDLGRVFAMKENQSL